MNASRTASHAGERPTRVLVVGCGIAGATLSAFLEGSEGIEYDVVERVETFGRSGYGIALWPNGLDVLDELGNRDIVCQRGNTVPKIRFRTASGRVDSTIELPDVGPGPEFVAVHRADLHESLVELVPDERIQFHTTVETIRERDWSVAVELSSGEMREYDLVVGADGVWSKTRELCFDDEYLASVDTAVWSFWTEPTAAFPAVTTSVSGPSTEAFLVTIDGRGLVNVGTKLDSLDGTVPTVGHLQRAVDELGWVLPEALERREGDLFADRVREVSMDRWALDRVALVGDAAHAVHPISGMGGALALADARTLATWLDSSLTVPAIVDQYYRTRVANVRSVQRDAVVLERVLLADSRPIRLLRDGLLSATSVIEWSIDRRLRALTPNDHS